MNATLLVAAGGAIGAASRHLVSVWTLRQFGPGFPVGTLSVNILGSLLMGLLIGILATRDGGNTLRLFIGVGVLGGFTTFSAFSLDAIRLLETKQFGQASLYIGASVGASLIALMLGLFLARQIA